MGLIGYGDLGVRRVWEELTKRRVFPAICNTSPYRDDSGGVYGGKADAVHLEIAR